jgi:quercetin dioxygenase-like cupin family protein
MKLITLDKYKQIQSDTCGSLIELLNDSNISVSITIAENLKPTKAHYHKSSTEIYWVEKGKLEIQVNRIKKFRLGEGNILVINPNEIHEVINASEENRVIILNSPNWKKEDEYII